MSGQREHRPASRTPLASVQQPRVWVQGPWVQPSWLRWVCPLRGVQQSFSCPWKPNPRPQDQATASAEPEARRRLQDCVARGGCSMVLSGRHPGSRELCRRRRCRRYYCFRKLQIACLRCRHHVAVAPDDCGDCPCCACCRYPRRRQYRRRPVLSATLLLRLGGRSCSCLCPEPGPCSPVLPWPWLCPCLRRRCSWIHRAHRDDHPETAVIRSGDRHCGLLGADCSTAACADRGLCPKAIRTRRSTSRALWGALMWALPSTRPRPHVGQRY